MCPIGDPEAFKKEYIAHVRELTGHELDRLKAESYDKYLDRVADVLDYVFDTFNQTRYMMTDNFLRTVYTTAVENARYATHTLDHRTKPWHINERLEYVRAVSNALIQKIEPLL